MKLGLWFKLVLLRLHLCAIFNVREFCKDCGVVQRVVWLAPNDLWAEVRDKPLDEDGGVLCCECFDKRAEAKGMLLMWRPEVEMRRGEQAE